MDHEVCTGLCAICHYPITGEGLRFLPRLSRFVPHFSGEGAIYTPEYLARREGNALGAQRNRWRWMPVH